MFTATVCMKGNVSACGPSLSPTYTSVRDHNHLSMKAYGDMVARGGE